ncbi:hypothetical protein ACVWW5_002396 [Bradyrhizobium sp. LM3.4]
MNLAPRHLRAAYRSGELKPSDVAAHVLSRLDDADQSGVWISTANPESVMAKGPRARCSHRRDRPTAALRPRVLGQGLYRCGRRADHLGLPGIRLHRERHEPGCRRRHRRRRDLSRQNQHGSVRDRPGRRALALWHRPQPAQPGLHSRRLQLGRRGIGRDRHLVLCFRHGYRRIGQGAGVLLWRDRLQARARRLQSARHGLCVPKF